MSFRVPRSQGSAASTLPVNHNGLVVQIGNGYERMVMTDQEVCDDVLSTLPKLKAAASRDTFGRRWKQRRRKNGVDMFELIPGGGDDPDDDLDIAHAMVAKTELRCHLNEVLNVLINQTSSDYEASMQALCGSRFKQGKVLFSQRRKLLVRTRDTPESDNVAPQDGLVGVQLATLRPKLQVKIQTKHKRTQKLCFSSCTHQYPSKDRAFHLMKTIPKDAHDQVVASHDRSSLRREIDHIAVGFDIQSKHGGYGSVNHSTRIFLHTYASTVPPSQFGRYGSRQTGLGYSAADLARRRESIMNPEAHHVMDLLTKSLREIETVIRRRRFGFQTFVYFPTMYDSEANKANCSICRKNFSFFRRDFFCQLCGNMVCGDCSKLYEVEARIGEVRKNRCCVQCVVRVDACVFDDEQLIPGLGPVIVDVDEEAWYQNDSLEIDDDDTISVGSNHSSVDEITDNLYSNDPMQRSQALEMLAQIVNRGSQDSKTLRTTQAGKSAPVSTKEKKKKVMRAIDDHIVESLRSTKHKYANSQELVVYNDERDYVFNFGYDNNPNVPLAPMPDANKEAKRLKYIKESGVLEEKYDRTALDMLAQVAAKKLNCPIGFVSVVDESQFRAIGTYNLPEVAFALPRDENLCMHSVYAEKPMVIKNPQRDMRFAQMGCIKDLGVKFYAGFPVCAPDGSVVASLCTGDVVPHNNITTKDYATMEALSKLAADLIVPKSPARLPASMPPQPVRGAYQSQEPSFHSGQGQRNYTRDSSNVGPNGQRQEPYIVY